jgi:hypothetical protein
MTKDNALEIRYGEPTPEELRNTIRLDFNDEETEEDCVCLEEEPKDICRSRRRKKKVAI